MTTSLTVPPVDVVAPGLRTRAPDGAFSGAATLALGVVGLAASVAGPLLLGESWRQFLLSYLVAYMFVLSIVLGGMFFVLIQHVTRAGWSVTVRRIAENVMGVMPLMLPLFVPIAVGYGTIYHHWAHPDPADVVLAGKAPYLNATFFFVRAAIYFAVWIGIARWFRNTSIRQDETGDAALTLKMARAAAPSLVLFALTLTFAAVDWLMTLYPHWFSTIWGVYFFAGSFMGFMAVLGLACMWLRAKGMLREAIHTEHYHDIGKLLFAWVVFWTYIAFSQYMLIWYGNLPEETAFFHEHRAGSWELVARALMVGHFMVPFVFLMSRHAKRNLVLLAVASVGLLFMHFVDLYWIVMPALHHHGVHVSWLDAGTMVGLIGLTCWSFVVNLRRAPLIPERDPRLPESLRFVNQ